MGVQRVATREDVLAEAREWINTPFHHQAALKGVGCDCVGLVRGVGANTQAFDRAFGGEARFTNYDRTPNPSVMLKGLGAYMRSIRTEEVGPADVMYLYLNDLARPQHLVIVGERGWVVGGPIIHAQQAPRPGRVVEVSLSAAWYANSFRGGWRFPRLTDG